MTELEQAIRAETSEIMYERGYGSQRFGEVGLGGDNWLILLIVAAVALLLWK